MACQQVFRSQREDGQRDIRKTVDQIADSPIAACRDQAHQILADFGAVQPLGQPFAARKQTRTNAVTFQLRAEGQDFGPFDPVTRRRVSLDGHPSTAHSSWWYFWARRD